MKTNLIQDFAPSPTKVEIQEALASRERWWKFVQETFGITAEDQRQAFENQRLALQEITSADWYNQDTMRIMEGSDGIVYLVDAEDNSKIIKQWGKRKPAFAQRQVEERVRAALRF